MCKLNPLSRFIRVLVLTSIIITKLKIPTKYKWFIVDSCIEPKSKEIPVLNYLDQIGVESSHAVKLIVASHWHDDHVRGLSTIVETCRSAQFCLSSALRAKEFLTLIAAYSKRTMMVSSGIKEFCAVIEACVVKDA